MMFAVLLSCLVASALMAGPGTRGRSEDDRGKTPPAGSPSRVEFLGVGGEPALPDPATGIVQTKQVRFLDPTGQGLTMQQGVAFGKAYTVFQSGDTCLIHERDLTLPAPSVKFLSGTSEDAAVLAESSGICAGCATFPGKAVNFDVWGCATNCPQCTCTHCFSGPCPDDPGPVNPQPAPDPDRIDTID